MENTFKEELKSCDVNIERALEAFMGNEALYEKFLIKFLDDTNYDKLKQSIQSKNLDDAFFSAHTLKGVASNLHLQSIVIPITKIVEILRKKSFEGIDELVVTVTENYDKLIGVISKYIK